MGYQVQMGFDDPWWREFFLHPKKALGIVVQVVKVDKELEWVCNQMTLIEYPVLHKITSVGEQKDPTRWTNEWEGFTPFKEPKEPKVRRQHQ